MSDLNIFSLRDTYNYAREGVEEFSGALEDLSGELESSQKNEVENSVLEADLLYGSGGRSDSMMPLVDELEDRNYSAEIIDKNDIKRRGDDVYVKGVPGNELSGKDMIWRRLGFIESMGEWESILEDIEQLRNNGVKTLPTPNGVVNCDNKRNTKKILENRDVSTTELYETYEDVRKAQQNGNIVVEKPPSGSQGRGIEFLTPEDDIDFKQDYVYEEFVDHVNNPYIMERRAVTFTGDNVNQFVEVKNREKKDNDPELKTKNISNGNGKYTDLDPETRYLTDEEMNEVLNAAEAIGGGILGFDYTVDLRTGETKIIEANSNVGVSGLTEASDIDFYDTLADAVEKELEDEYGGRTYSEHLDEVLGPGFEEKAPSDQLEYGDLEENVLEPASSAESGSSGYSDASNKAVTV